MNKTEVIEQNLNYLSISHREFLKSGMNHIKLKDTDTVVGSLIYLESIFDNLSTLYQPHVNNSDDYNLDYEFYSTLSKIKLLLGLPTDFAVNN